MADRVSREYRPALAWQLAIIYFAAIAVTAWLCAVPQGLWQGGPDFLAWLSEPEGVITASVYLTLILGVYGVIWRRGSFSDGRRSAVAVSLVFGLVWGVAQGLAFLSLYQVVAWLTLPAWASFVIAYLLIASYTGLLHSQFWDIWVSPPHNYREWNLPKVLLCHSPNLIVGLSLLIWLNQPWLFFLMQPVALGLCAVVMRFPPWWSRYRASAGEQRSITSRA